MSDDEKKILEKQPKQKGTKPSKNSSIVEIADEKGNVETHVKSNEATEYSKQLSIEEMAMEQIRLTTEQLQLSEKQFREARIAWIIAFLALIVAIIGIYLAYLGISNKVSALNPRLENVERNVLAGRFIIISPSDGASVDATDIVRGKTPFPEMNHYIVITSLKTGDDFVQDNPAKFDVTGSFASNARFGTGDVGVGEKFLIRVLATKSTIPPGTLTDVPPDAVFSESVTVKREK